MGILNKLGITICKWNKGEYHKEKIRKGDVIGLDNVIVATSNDFDKLIIELKNFNFSEPPTVKVIESKQIITKEKLEKILTYNLM